MDEQAKMMTKVKRTNEKCDICMQKVEESNVHFKFLESQVTHLISLMQQRQPETLPSNTEADPRGKAQCKAVMVLREGKKKVTEEKQQAEDSNKELEEVDEQVADLEKEKSENRAMPAEKKREKEPLRLQSVPLNPPESRYEP